MGEEILKVSLAELLQTIRLKQKDGTITEVSGAESAVSCCAKIRNGDEPTGQALMDFFNLAARLTEKSFPVKVEFAVKGK